MGAQLHCSFCFKPSEQVAKLIAGPNNVYICDECVALCAVIVLGDTPRATVKAKTAQETYNEWKSAEYRLRLKPPVPWRSA